MILQCAHVFKVCHRPQYAICHSKHYCHYNTRRNSWLEIDDNSLHLQTASAFIFWFWTMTMQLESDLTFRPIFLSVALGRVLRRGRDETGGIQVTSSPRNFRAKMRRKAATIRPATTNTNTCNADPSVSGVCDHDSNELWNIRRHNMYQSLVVIVLLSL